MKVPNHYGVIHLSAAVTSFAAVLLVLSLAAGGNNAYAAGGSGSAPTGPTCTSPKHQDISVTVSYSNGTVTAPPADVKFCTIAKISLESADPSSYQVSVVHGCDTKWPVKISPVQPGRVVMEDANVNKASRGDWFYRVTVRDNQGDHTSAPCKADPWIHNG